MNQIQSMKEQDIKYLILKEIIEYNIVIFLIYYIIVHIFIILK